MPQEVELKVKPEQAYDDLFVRDAVCRQLHLHSDQIQALVWLKRSIDARKQIHFVLRLMVYLKGDSMPETLSGFQVGSKTLQKKIAVIGFGPAGIFAAFQLLENGYLPLIIERGKTVQERRRDLAVLNKELRVNPESNYCFGEGGAGTYSDGKLYTRSKKRGNVLKVLQTFVDHGAMQDILVNAHPHIGTNKLPAIIERMREAIIHAGGEIRFNSKLTDLRIQNDKVQAVQINHSEEIEVDAVILATGHSARDIFELMQKKGIDIEAKPFALGLRIEHPQEIIDRIQYKLGERGEFLPPASYSLVTQAAGNGVFSFCMCPGGIIAPAATDVSEIVVNGWSPSKRNGQFANSGMVVTVNPPHWLKSEGEHPLAALQFQKKIEEAAYRSTGSIQAPAQRMDDFIRGKLSSDLPACSYLPGVLPRALNQILPEFINRSLSEGLAHFGKTLKGYRSNEAILVGVESRTSSPVRIPRDKEKLHHIRIKNLYPCGEGAGYAGGIVSAALDGMACAGAIQ